MPNMTELGDVTAQKMKNGLSGENGYKNRSDWGSKKFLILTKISYYFFQFLVSLLIIKYFIKIIREVEDSIQTALNDPGAESRHPYAPETQANNNSNQKNGVS